VSKEITRRSLLALWPASFAVADVRAKKTNPLPRAGEFVRYLDPATETIVVRLTNPATTSALPAPTNRFVSMKDSSLFFSSDRTGRMCPFRTGLRTGLAQQVAETSALEPESLCLDQTGRLLYLVDQQILKEVTLATKKMRSIADDVQAFGILGGGEFAVVRRGRLELLNAGPPSLAEEVGAFCLVRPGGKGCLFLREISTDQREFWYAPFPGDAAGGKPALLAKGCISNPFWSPDGRSVLFLREMPNAGGVITSEIHEAILESGTEQRITLTSQFGAFAPNGDATVFVGASRSKAQPTVILLLRAVQREMTLCEHRAKQPGLVSPVFSPDSRRVYFQSDRDGKPALYSVNVESLVEPTVSAV
jgi:oligogalacturonide lyase